MPAGNHGVLSTHHMLDFTIDLQGLENVKRLLKKGLDNISEFCIGERTFTDKQAALFIHELITVDILQGNIRDLNERGSLPFITLGSKAVFLVSGKLHVTRRIRTETCNLNLHRSLMFTGAHITYCKLISQFLFRQIFTENCFG